MTGGEEERPARSKGAASGPGGRPRPHQLARLITFICSLVIIAAALVIVFAVIYPKIHSPGNADPGASGIPVPDRAPLRRPQ